MANKTINDLDELTSVDRAADYLEVADASDLNASKRTSVNSMLNLSSQPLGLTDVQSPTNKTFNNTNTFTIKDDRFTLQDNADTTKQAVFQLSGITTGTTRTYTLPNVSDTLVSLTASQTLTNKTLTSPTISAPTITNPTMTVDAISEFTAANGVTIDGLNIKDSKLNTNDSVVTANITDRAVTYPKVDSGFVIQETVAGASAASTLTANIPNDDTIPQITEGTEVITCSFTPKDTGSTLIVEALVFGSNSTVANLKAALFRDATADAITATGTVCDNAGGIYPMRILATVSAGSTAATIFRVRVGTDGGTYTFNGVGGSRLYGAINKSWVKITEVKV